MRHDDPCDNHDGAFDTGPRNVEPKPSGPQITYRISYMLRAKTGEQIYRHEHTTATDDMAIAISEWRIQSSALYPKTTNGGRGLFVVACTIADHPAMHETVDA